MLGSKFGGKAIGLGIQNIGNIALLPKLNFLGLMGGSVLIAHCSKQVSQLLWIRMCKFNKFKPICANRIGG